MNRSYSPQKIVIHKPGGWSVLQYESFNPEAPQDQEVLVKIKAISVNFADIAVRLGLYESAKQYVGWPITPGFDFAGVIEKVGSGVNRFKEGDAVFGVTFFGAYSTHITVPKTQIFHLPTHWDFKRGASFSTVHLTAWYALHTMGAGQQGQRALVHSAAGGVGQALLQLCKHSGIHTTGIVYGEHKVDVARNAGADEVIDKQNTSLWGSFDQINPKGCDLIFDANGYETLRQGYDRLRPEGRLICYGAATMLKRGGGRIPWFRLAWRYLTRPKFDPLAMTSENRSVLAFNLSFLFHKTDLLKEAIDSMIKLDLIEPSYTCFPFTDVVRAHQLLESGTSVGKIMLMVDDE